MSFTLVCRVRGSAGPVAGGARSRCCQRCGVPRPRSPAPPPETVRDTWWVSRACGRQRCRPPGLHPGHPTAEEGCRPASRGLSLALMTCSQATPRRLSTRHTHLSSRTRVGAALSRPVSGHPDARRVRRRDRALPRRRGPASRCPPGGRGARRAPSPTTPSPAAVASAPSPVTQHRPRPGRVAGHQGEVVEPLVARAAPRPRPTTCSAAQCAVAAGEPGRPGRRGTPRGSAAWRSARPARRGARRPAPSRSRCAGVVGAAGVAPCGSAASGRRVGREAAPLEHRGEPGRSPTAPADRAMRAPVAVAVGRP